MNIAELATFRGGITTLASGTVTTTYLQAKDTQGIGIKNATGTSVMTISDEGAVTAGPASSTSLTQTFNGNVFTFSALGDTATDTQANITLKPKGNASSTILSNIAADTGANPVFSMDGRIGSAAVSTRPLFSLRNFGTTVLDCTAAGAWTLGPASGLNAVHIMQAGTGINSALKVLKTNQTKNANNSYYQTFTGSDGDDGYVATNGSGVLTLVDVASDMRLKENIRENLFGLSDIMSLRPITYDWKDNSNKDIKGFIAQEVQQVLPESVMENPTGYLSLETQTMIPVLVKAIQEQQAMIEELKAKVAALEAK